jgi:hypothetical protein
MDAKDLLPGQEWKVEIEKAIRESAVFIACLSNNSVNKEGFVQAELKRALEIADLMPEGRIFIVPIRLDNCKVPISLSKLHWVDYFEDEEREKLLKAIRHRINPPNKNTMEQTPNTNQYKAVERMRMNIASLESNSVLMVEHLHPQIASRKIEAQLRQIRTDTGPDDESYLPSVRAEFVKQRIDAFNKITGWEFTEDDDKFIEYTIDNPEQLHVQLAFEEMDKDNWGKDWVEYRSVIGFLKREQDKVGMMDNKSIDEMEKWTSEKAGSVYDWVKTHIPGVMPKDFSPTSFF